MGMSLANVGLIYTSNSIVRVFLITAATFGGMSLLGYTTKKDLTKKPKAQIHKYTKVGGGNTELPRQANGECVGYFCTSSKVTG